MDKHSTAVYTLIEGFKNNDMAMANDALDLLEEAQALYGNFIYEFNKRLEQL